MQNETVREIKAIMDYLGKADWETIDGDTLVRAQGKLAAYQGNLSELVNAARKESELTKVNVKKLESEKYLEYRNSGETSKDSEINAAVDALESRMRALDVEERYLYLKGLLDALQSLTVACQVALREKRSERFNSGYVENA